MVSTGTKKKDRAPFSLVKPTLNKLTQDNWFVFRTLCLYSTDSNI